MKSRYPKSLLQKYAFALGGVWLVFLPVSIMIYSLILCPQSVKIQTLQNQIQMAGEDYELAQRARRPETKQRIQENLDGALQTLHQFISSPDSASRLTVNISQLAAQCHLNDFSVKTRDMTPTLDEQSRSKVTETWLELTFAASFNNCAAYINALERNEPVIFVESAEIQRSNQENQHPTARVLISYLIDIQPPTNTKNQNPAVAAAQ